ncbi:MAG: putative oxidoreductase [Candidatus Anoxychlamydiales bacterium]|nr:putative oxidoreductase [Candidatus Anoxychlamydiales bacterium]
MESKKLLSSTSIPMIGLGTWLQDEETKCISAIKDAFKIGYTHIDTADIYKNHIYIAKAIAHKNRKDLFITTKLWIDFLDPKNVESEVDKCLMQLNLDYLDLYLIHWPDRTKPIIDVYYEMTRLKEKGKIKATGVSNYTINHIQDLLDQKLVPEVNQVEFHPYLYQKDLLDFCNRHSIAITAYCPIAREKVFEDKELIAIGKKYNKSPSQVSLNWIISKDIIVIPKASSINHLKEDFDIFNFNLSAEDIKIIDEIHYKRGSRLINPEFADFEY